MSREELKIHYRNRDELRKRIAMYGPGKAPLFLQNQLDDVEEIIRRLQQEAGLGSLEEVRGRKKGCMIWWGPLSNGTRAAYIGLIGTVIAASIGLIGVLGAPIITEWARSRFAPTATPVAIATRPTSTATTTPTHAAMSAPIREVLIKIDDTAIDTGGGHCREIVRNSRHRIEVTILDSEGTTLQPGVFSYRWRFNPPDEYNREKLEEDFKGNAISYYASPKLNSQTVTVEVLREKKMVAVRSICFNFNIKKQL